MRSVAFFSLLAVAIRGAVAFPTPGEASAAGCPYAALYGRHEPTGLKGKRDASIPDMIEHGLLEDRSQLNEIKVTRSESRRSPSPDPEPIVDGNGNIHLVGRGLLDGVLAPLTGILQAIDIPFPQEQGLTLIPKPGDRSHDYEDPYSTDVRGLCPTMNTLANHGYIDRTGITTFAEAANAVQTVWGFAYDMSVVLSLLGLIAGGDLLSGKYSIGGYDSRVPATLGKVNGLNQHGRFEVDASPSRSDAYFGDNHTLNKTRYNTLVSLANQYSGGHFNNEMGYQSRSQAYAESRALNPQFDATAGYILVSAATRFFWYRGLSNGTTPNDCNKFNFDSFYLHERIPNLWFRRPSAYTLVNFLEDVVDFQINSFVLPGQNQGIDNFVPLTTSIPEAPGELVCFILSTIMTASPAQLAGPFLNSVNNALIALTQQVVAPILGGSGYKCNLTLNTIDEGSGGGVTNKRRAVHISW